MHRMFFCLAQIGLLLTVTTSNVFASTPGRERISINDGWRFMKYESDEKTDSLIYDERPKVRDTKDDRSADAEPTEAEQIKKSQTVLKEWVLPTGNDFINDPAKHHVRPEGSSPGSDFPFVQIDFDDTNWERLSLPHDWAIKGPFMQGYPTPVGGGMGRLPSPGVAWYRKKIEVSAADKGKKVFLDVDGAMSYAMVWCNGQLVGGWPFGYSSWRVDLTSYSQCGRRESIGNPTR